QRPWLPLPDGKGSDTFYKFPNRTEPVRKEGYQWNPNDQPFQDVMDSQFNEVALDYNAGFTASLAWLTAHGLSSGNAMSDKEFPPKAKRNESTHPLTTDREFLVVAKELNSSADQIEIEAVLWNRSRWPSQVTTNLGFRYYFTLDGGTKTEQVRAEVSGSEQAKVSAPKLVSKNVAFVEISFLGDAIYPGSAQTCRRSVKVRLSAPGWNSANDWSHEGMIREAQLLPHMPVYNQGKLVGGAEPR
ncbi:MAG TPA: cellulose binding domain-containing protein, partial [Clostridia bacterium]|nr:cellulose binding domain-containing protein [Clostridia bacterium]